jgi:signal peptidase II
MNKMTAWLSRVAPVLLIGGIIIGLDQWTKIWVRDTIPKFTYIIPIPQLGEYFVFEHVDNYGAAFGMFQNMGQYFSIVAVIVAVAILYYAGTSSPQQHFLRVLLGMQLGGALGNAIDRVYQGFVTDFIKMGIPGVYYWPNYNIADSAIVCGVIGLAIYIFAEDIRAHRAQRQAAQAGAQHPATSQDA